MIPLSSETKLTHFNSRPRKEVDEDTLEAVTYRLHFNSRPRKEVD